MKETPVERLLHLLNEARLLIVITHGQCDIPEISKSKCVSVISGEKLARTAGYSIGLQQVSENLISSLKTEVTYLD